MSDYISREAALIVLDWDCASQDALDAIKAIPAADVVEVRHGRWYLDNGCAYCSECKNNFTPAIRSQALFCPRCGAKMDGGQDDV